MSIWIDNEWAQLWQRCNWQTWRPLGVCFERDCKEWGGWWQFELYILGFGLIISQAAKEN
ncbi:MAG: hypothetical protein WC962_09690 [Phycisphaerae bacterium]